MTLFEQLLAEKKAKDECDKAIAEARQLAREEWILGLLPHLKGVDTVTMRGDYGKPINRVLKVAPGGAYIETGSNISPGSIGIAMDHSADVPKCKVSTRSIILYEGSDQLSAAKAFLEELVKHVHAEHR